MQEMSSALNADLLHTLVSIFAVHCCLINNENNYKLHLKGLTFCVFQVIIASGFFFIDNFYSTTS